jgi:RimJ/RimL family protein N-acetyltransferase
MLPRTLHTARLTLRPPQDDDAEWIAREIARPAVHQMLTSPPRPYSLQDARTWLASLSGQSGTFVIVADDPVGVIAIDRDADGNELGYWLRVGAWGHGYMTEAGLSVVSDWFAGAGDDLVSGHLIANAASAGVLAKLGFRNESQVMRHSGFWGRDVKLQAMRLTKARWLDHMRLGAQVT